MKNTVNRNFMQVVTKVLGRETNNVRFNYRVRFSQDMNYTVVYRK